MKLLLALLAAATLAGCTTDQNGNTVLDIGMTKAVIDTTFQTYDRYRTYQQPAYTQPLYQSHQVIQPAPGVVHLQEE